VRKASGYEAKKNGFSDHFRTWNDPIESNGLGITVVVEADGRSSVSDRGQRRRTRVAQAGHFQLPASGCDARSDLLARPLGVANQLAAEQGRRPRRRSRFLTRRLPVAMNAVWKQMSEFDCRPWGVPQSINDPRGDSGCLEFGPTHSGCGMTARVLRVIKRFSYTEKTLQIGIGRFRSVDLMEDVMNFPEACVQSHGRNTVAGASLRWSIHDVGIVVG